MVGDVWDYMDLIDEWRIVGEEQIKGFWTSIDGPRWLCDYLIQKVAFGNRHQLLALGSMQMVGFDHSTTVRSKSPQAKDGLHYELLYGAGVRLKVI